MERSVGKAPIVLATTMVLPDFEGTGSWWRLRAARIDRTEPRGARRYRLAGKPTAEKHPAWNNYELARCYTCGRYKPTNEIDSDKPVANNSCYWKIFRCDRCRSAPHRNLVRVLQPHVDRLVSTWDIWAYLNKK